MGIIKKKLDFDLVLEGSRIANLDELRKHPSFALIELCSDGRLARWLRRHGAENKADLLEKITLSGDKQADLELICHTLGIDSTKILYEEVGNESEPLSPSEIETTSVKKIYDNASFFDKQALRKELFFAFDIIKFMISKDSTSTLYRNRDSKNFHIAKNVSKKINSKTSTVLYTNFTGGKIIISEGDKRLLFDDVSDLNVDIKKIPEMLIINSSGNVRIFNKASSSYFGAALVILAKNIFIETLDIDTNAILIADNIIISRHIKNQKYKTMSLDRNRIFYIFANNSYCSGVKDGDFKFEHVSEQDISSAIGPLKSHELINRRSPSVFSRADKFWEDPCNTPEKIMQDGASINKIYAQACLLGSSCDGLYASPEYAFEANQAAREAFNDWVDVCGVFSARFSE